MDGRGFDGSSIGCCGAWGVGGEIGWDIASHDLSASIIEFASCWRKRDQVVCLIRPMSGTTRLWLERSDWGCASSASQATVKPPGPHSRPTTFEIPQENTRNVS